MDRFSALATELKRTLPGLELREEEPMWGHTTFRVGGPARLMALPGSRKEAAAAVRAAAEEGIAPFFLGNGSNLLVSDAGYEGFVLKVSGLDRVWEANRRLRAESGISLARLARAALGRGLTGLEFAHGIPGTLGGAVVMNAGAYGGELKDVVTEVTALYPDGVKVLTPAELDFSYRHSVFSAGEGIVLGAKVKLESGDPDAIKAKMDDLMARRKASQPLELPSAGSTFKRPTGYYAGPLIEGCGLKGCRVGGAEVSSKHAGFVVNVGGATCADVLALIEKVQKTVYDAHGVMLEPEVKIIR